MQHKVPGKSPIVNTGFGKIKTKDSKYGMDVLFGGLNLIIEVQKMK